MAAHILLTIEKLEKQQINIQNQCHISNKEVLIALDSGMKENQDTMK